MTDASPFRERPKFLFCPRCGETLDHAFDAVVVCLRCEGVWIAPLSIEKAFGKASWPEAQTMWWRNSLECPECASIGVATVMTAAMAGSVLIDRCTNHGVWLDRGELGRLMGGDTANDAGDDDLAALRDKLSVGAADLAGLIGRRDAWRADLAKRRESAADYRSWLEAEEGRRTAAAAADQLARATQRKQYLEHAEREREAAKLLAEAHRQRDQRLQELGDSRARASSDVAQLEAQIITVRAQMRSLEARLDGERARIRAMDDQLAALQR